MLQCESVDPTFHDQYYNTSAERAFRQLDRLENSLLQHGLYDQFLGGGRAGEALEERMALMKLNWRHKAGLFLTLVAVGCGLFLECSAKQAVGIALLGIAFAWLIGSLTPRAFSVTFAILICAVGLYVPVAPVWSDFG